MRFYRRPKRWLSGWLAMLLLVSQLATAAYACPATGAASLRMAPSAALPDMPHMPHMPHMPNMPNMPNMPSMPGCDGRMAGLQDPDQPLLCQAHCQQGALTVHPTPATDAPPSPVLLAVLDWAPAAWLPTQPAARASALAPGAAPPGAPPRYLVLLVLRN